MYKKASILGFFNKSLDNPGISGWLVSIFFDFTVL